MSNYIKHSGIIESIEQSKVRVRIVQASACASCKIASHCDVSDASTKIVEICAEAEGLSEGQKVIISTSNASAHRAVFIAFIIPLLILIGMLIGTKTFGFSDASAALTSITLLLPYYISVWLLRNRIAKSISFRIEL